MPMITWGPQLELGFELIDKQHKGLVDLINELHEAVDKGEGQEATGRALVALVDYTHTHFRDEEALLQTHSYEDLTKHRREHRIFTDQIEMYRDRFQAGSMRVTDAVLDYLRDWLLGHIARSDRAYSRTLEEAGVE